MFHNSDIGSMLLPTYAIISWSCYTRPQWGAWCRMTYVETPHRYKHTRPSARAAPAHLHKLNWCDRVMSLLLLTNNGAGSPAAKMRHGRIAFDTDSCAEEKGGPQNKRQLCIIALRKNSAWIGEGNSVKVITASLLWLPVAKIQVSSAICYPTDITLLTRYHGSAMTFLYSLRLSIRTAEERGRCYKM